MAEITVSIQGNKELAAKLKKFGVAMLDLTSAMDDVGEYLTGFFSGEVFASRGRAFNKPWSPLNDRYAAWKARRWPGRGPLIRTGLMQRSFKHRSTKLSTSLWNEAQYFDYHQDGEGVPQRVMMHVDAKRKRAILQLVSDDLDRKQRAANV